MKEFFFFTEWNIFSNLTNHSMFFVLLLFFCTEAVVVVAGFAGLGTSVDTVILLFALTFSFLNL